MNTRLYIFCCIYMAGFILLSASALMAVDAIPPVQNPDRHTSQIDAVIKEAQEMQRLLQQKKIEGYNVVEAEKLDRMSKEAAYGGDYKTCLQLIRNAAALLIQMGPRETAKSHLWVELPVISKTVIVTKAVPNSVSMRSAKNYAAPFKPVTHRVDSINGKVGIKVDEFPVFIEEKSERPSGLNTPSETLPFGIHDLQRYDSHLKDLNAKWVRLSGAAGIVWDADEPEKGRFDWTRTDRIISEFYHHNIHMVVTVLCLNRWDQKRDFWKTVKDGPFKGARVAVAQPPKDMNAFCRFLSAAVERYDGDGVDDAPGSPIVNHWQIENEPDGAGWGGTPEEFAQLVKASSPVIRKSNPNAEIVLAGIATYQGFRHFYMPMFDALKDITGHEKDKLFDIVDFHWSVESGGNYRFAKNSGMKQMVDALKKKLSSTGYGDTRVWITEMSSYSGMPVHQGVAMKPVTEAQHAAALLKSYIHCLSLGIKKVFWVSIQEHHNCGNLQANNYWDKTGLIHNPANQGKSHKKLAYYSYKLMVEKLEGSDWNRVETLDLGRRVHAYKFPKKGNRPVYVLWCD